MGNSIPSFRGPLCHNVAAMGRSEARANWVGFGLFQGAFCYVHWGFWQRWDLPIHDGLFYFQQARRWPIDQLLLPREWSPLYLIGYSAFQRMLAFLDPFWVYALHRLLVLYLVSLVFWLIARRFLDGRTAGILTVLLVCNQTLLENFHVIHSAGLLWVLITLWAASAQRPNSYLPAALALCGAFVRPEFLVAFAVLATHALWRRVFPGEGQRRLERPGWPAVLALVLALGLWAISEAPAEGPSRSFQAFAQQQAWAEEGEASVVSGFQHLDRAAQRYGSASTLLEALRANPTAFLGTVTRNLSQLPGALGQAGSVASVAPWVSHLLLLLVLAATLSAASILRMPGLPFWAAAAAFSAAALAASTLIRPTAPYLLGLIPPVLVGAGVTLSPRLRPFRLDPAIRRLAGGLRWAGLLVIVAAAGHSLRPQGQPFREFSKELARSGSPSRVLAYSPESYCLYPSQRKIPCSGVGLQALAGATDWAGLLEQESINVVVADVAMRQAVAELRRNDLESFESDPGAFGFHRTRETGGGLLARLFTELPLEKDSRLYQEIGPRQ